MAPKSQVASLQLLSREERKVGIELTHGGYVKVAEDLKHLRFFSVKINISTTGGYRVGFFQPDTNHP